MRECKCVSQLVRCTIRKPFSTAQPNACKADATHWGISHEQKRTCCFAALVPRVTSWRNGVFFFVSCFPILTGKRTLRQLYTTQYYCCLHRDSKRTNSSELSPAIYRYVRRNRSYVCIRAIRAFCIVSTLPQSS